MIWRPLGTHTEVNWWVHRLSTIEPGVMEDETEQGNGFITGGKQDDSIIVPQEKVGIIKAISKLWLSFGNLLKNNIIAKWIQSFDRLLSGLGTKLDLHQRRVEPRRKYTTEIVLRIPLFFLIHWWIHLSPISDYRLIELVLFIIRYFVSLQIAMLWESPTKASIFMLTDTGINLSFGWLLDLNYRMFQNEADGVCDVWWGDMEASWWTVSLGSMVLLVFYAIYRYLHYGSMLFIAVCLVQLICVSAIFLNVTAPLYYFLTMALFVVDAIYQTMCYYVTFTLKSKAQNSSIEECKNLYLNYQEGMKNPTLRHWFIRDLLAAFVLLFYCFCLMINIYRLGSNTIFTLSFMENFIGDWCTSFVIVAGLSALFGLLSQFIVGSSRVLIPGQRAAVSNVKDKFPENFTIVGFCCEAGILYVDDDISKHNFKIVIFLTMCCMLTRVWDIVERHCYVVVNSEEIQSAFANRRVLIFVFTFTSSFTLIVFKASAFLNIDIWVLLNASGTVIILGRAFCVLIEFFLGTLIWHIHNYIDKVEDAIFFTGLFKNLATSVAVLMMGYYRLTSLFSQGWILVSLFVIIFDLWGAGKLLFHRDWAIFQNRRVFLKRLDAIPNATEDQLREVNDVCSICFAPMREGKGLLCSHIFHKACLRRWFQLRTACPLCNTVVF